MRNIFLPTRLIILACLFFSYTFSSAQSARQIAKPKGSTSAPYGFYEYLPQGYDSQSKLPVIIALHGLGELGNGTSNLDKAIAHGPGKEIKNGRNFSFIVISPQTPVWWNSNGINEMVEYIKKTYKVDHNRIYMTGLSMGAIATFDYLAKYPNKIAAAVPIAGNGSTNNACKFNETPIWAFHGDKDNIVGYSGSLNMVNAINKCKPKAKAKAKLTTYPGVKHDSWTRTYNGSAGHDIYKWMLSYALNGKKEEEAPNKNPTVNAGSDQNLTLPTNAITLKGAASDSDGFIASFTWVKISGPSVSMGNSSSKDLALTKLVAGKYTFKLSVKDNKGASASDEVSVVVQNQVAESKPEGKSGLNYSYYEGNWKKLPNFKTLQPKKTGKVENVTLQPKQRNDHYAFTFDGFIEIAKAGSYTFYTSSDDGSKLYINGKEIVNNDGLHATTEKSGRIELVKGTHAITIAFFEADRGEMLAVSYAGPDIKKTKIPNNILFSEGTVTQQEDKDDDKDEEKPDLTSDNGLIYSYYEGSWSSLPDFSNLKAKKTGSVASFVLSPKLRNDKFAMKYDGFIDIQKEGDYTFYTASDDGSKLYINGKAVVNNDGLHPKEEKYGKVKLMKGKHAIQVTFFELDRGEVLEVAYQGPGISKRKIPANILYKGSGAEKIENITVESSKSSGLSYAYYEGTWNSLPDFSRLKVVKKGQVANFDLGPRKRNDRFGFVYQGFIEIDKEGDYTFYTSSDDGSKLYINNKQVVNNDGLHPLQERSGKIRLKAGKHPIQVTFFENDRGETLQVKYAGPGFGKTGIPNEKLFLDNSLDTTNETVALQFEKAEELNDRSQVQTYPNPFSDRLNVDIYLEEASVLEIQLFDFIGRVVHSYSEEAEKGSTAIELNLSNINLESGIYILRVNSQTFQISKRVVRQ